MLLRQEWADKYQARNYFQTTSCDVLLEVEVWESAQEDERCRGKALEGWFPVNVRYFVLNP